MLAGEKKNSSPQPAAPLRPEVAETLPLTVPLGPVGPSCCSAGRSSNLRRFFQPFLFQPQVLHKSKKNPFRAILVGSDHKWYLGPWKVAFLTPSWDGCLHMRYRQLQAGVLCHFLPRCCLTTERMQRALENTPDYQPFPRMGSGVEAISHSDLLCKTCIFSLHVFSPSLPFHLASPHTSFHSPPSSSFS